MPELPEVEVTRRCIEPFLVGRVIEAVHTTPASYFFLTPPGQLQKSLPGRKVGAVSRHGKYLRALLDNGQTLVLHLGMTGQLFSSGATSVRLLSAAARAALAPGEQAAFKPDKHTHLRLCFADGGPDVLFRDVRKFGKVLLLGVNGRDERLERLGIDALEASGIELFSATRKKRSPIKSLLLDQSVIAGIGNIYADEALFLAGVKPTRPCRRVKSAECHAIVAAAQRVMLRSIETGGSSISDYVAPDGTDGGYQDERQVYAREGEACPKCGHKIVRVIVGQRSSHYCPACQK